MLDINRKKIIVSTSWDGLHEGRKFLFIIRIGQSFMTTFGLGTKGLRMLYYESLGETCLGSIPMS